MTTETATSRVIAAQVFDPTQPRLFSKPKASDPAKHIVVSCSCESCPLLAQKKCVHISLFQSCPYGDWDETCGPTKRAKNFVAWMRERKAQHNVGWDLERPPTRLEFIGDYVYVPYAHAAHESQLSFIRGAFLRRSDWTIETVLALIDHRPRAIFGGEIASYQKESVPLLIQHIREVDPDMWRQLISVRPQYDVAPNYVGRTALIRTLAHPISISPYKDEYPVAWEWNGKTLTTTSQHAYGSTWGHIKAESVAIEIVPAVNAAVTVEHNAWVTPDTVFVD